MRRREVFRMSEEDKAWLGIDRWRYTKPGLVVRLLSTSYVVAFRHRVQTSNNNQTIVFKPAYAPHAQETRSRHRIRSSSLYERSQPW